MRLRLTAAGPAYPDEPEPIAVLICAAAPDVLWTDVDPAEITRQQNVRTVRAAREPDADAKG